jgi:threonine/homoserine/homoserine lactone efflux protein
MSYTWVINHPYWENQVTQTLLAFLGASFIIIATPGPDTALTIRNTLLGGRAGGIATAAGVALGQTVWAVATSLGVVALLVASEPLFLAVKWAGAAYLIWLGAQALWAALRIDVTPQPQARREERPRRLSPVAASRQGLISNLGNPKMAVFFASLLPQFVLNGAAGFSTLLQLGLVFSCMTFVWLAAYAALVAKAGDFLSQSKIRRAMEGATGAILIALGMRLAVEQR